jgi:hypothetical protein
MVMVEARLPAILLFKSMVYREVGDGQWKVSGIGAETHFVIFPVTL